ncbi:patatin-like phospholipase family protein [Sphingomonas sp. MMS24-J13]|uniref:patatin-like phospholipase family protein n=1 Tax=Sphingomonas sp. MMS24-J13 TaxID=3238686 RepID=UPI00384D7F29
MSEPRRRSRAPAAAAEPTATPFESIALLLQGGGALGAYQAGVYEALHEHGIEPTWIAGISIGAINSAIIAGNPPERRVARLRDFWEMASAPTAHWSGWLPSLLHTGMVRGVINQLAAGGVLMNGVPGFFSPRFPPPPLQPNGTPDAISWYDTSALKPTLERLVDFDRINDRTMRFSVGAVNVRTGNFAYFDNATDTIRPEHIMASGALPPAFPPVEVDGEYFWDGGMVSNTPLDWVLSARSDLDTLIFQVDLWSAHGVLPRDMAGVGVRMKEVQYSSRTRAATDEFRERQKLRAAFQKLLSQLPADLAATEEAKLLAAASDPAVYNIVQLIYHSPTYEGESKDYEFSRQTMEDHWRTGYDNARHTLAQPEVLTLPAEPSGVGVYDFTHEAAEHQVPAKSEKDNL